MTDDYLSPPRLLCTRKTSWRSFRTKSSCFSPRLRLWNCSLAMTSMFRMRKPSSRLWWCGWGMMSSIDNRTLGCFLHISACLFFLLRWEIMTYSNVLRLCHMKHTFFFMSVLIFYCDWWFCKSSSLQTWKTTRCSLMIWNVKSCWWRPWSTIFCQRDVPCFRAQEPNQENPQWEHFMQ